MKTLLFRRSYYEGIKTLSKADRLEVYETIMQFAFGGDDFTSLDEAARPLFETIKASIIMDNERYERTRTERN